MSNQGQNEGVRVLDDFECEAIHELVIPPGIPCKQALSEGIQVLQELVLDLALASTRLDKDGRRLPVVE